MVKKKTVRLTPTRVKFAFRSLLRNNSLLILCVVLVLVLVFVGYVQNNKFKTKPRADVQPFSQEELTTKYGTCDENMYNEQQTRPDFAIPFECSTNPIRTDCGSPEYGGNKMGVLNKYVCSTENGIYSWKVVEDCSTACEPVASNTNKSATTNQISECRDSDYTITSAAEAWKMYGNDHFSTATEEEKNPGCGFTNYGCAPNERVFYRNTKNGCSGFLARCLPDPSCGTDNKKPDLSQIEDCSYAVDPQSGLKTWVDCEYPEKSRGIHRPMGSFDCKMEFLGVPVVRACCPLGTKRVWGVNQNSEVSECQPVGNGGGSAEAKPNP